MYYLEVLYNILHIRQKQNWTVLEVLYNILHNGQNKIELSLGYNPIPNLIQNVNLSEK